MRWLRSRWGAACLDLVIVAGLGLLALRSFTLAENDISFYVDEGQYIWTSQYFNWLFVQHDLSRADWAEN